MQISPIIPNFWNGFGETQTENAQRSAVGPRSLLGGNNMLMKAWLDSLTGFHILINFRSSELQPSSEN